MKIAHIQHPFIPQMGYQENKLLQYQRELGHEPVCFTSTIQPADRGSSEEEFSSGVYEYDGVKVVRLDYWIRNAKSNSVLFKGLSRYLKYFSPDVIHFHGAINIALPQCAIFAHKHRIPLIVDDHIDSNNLDTNSTLNKALLFFYKNLVSRPVDTVVNHYLPIHEYSEKFLKDFLGVPEAKMSLLPLGIDTDTFYPDAEGGKIIADELGIGSEEFVVVSSGYFSPDKNIGTLIESIGELKSNDANITLLLVGPGPDKYIMDLQDQVDRLGLSDSVIFFGYASSEEMRRIYNAADLGVWPGIGISINEAIGTGLPILIGDYPSTRHLVSQSNVLSFTPNEAEDLKNKLELLMNDDELREDMAERSREYSSQELSWEMVAKKSIRIYDEHVGINH